ncbi:alpha/beta-hydrolase [Wolfiporia cocos MD-104 SS10]|uniref:Alpha/beta-hydrolase n=1 Tax=Wolfiporia cocos (strain MD-104) TaxID=742152 RepID=A0A2H3JE06_WOLCO|nr:alpha/beta-hydrolase [Wolfiporia cocos MD-104 SS10]
MLTLEAALATTIIGIFRLIAPTSIVFCCIVWVSDGGYYSPWLAAYAHLEALFYLAVYLPRKLIINTGPAAVPVPPRAERQILFDRWLPYLCRTDKATGWFYARKPTIRIQRENLRELLIWALFNTEMDKIEKDWEEEIEGYISRIEKTMGFTLEKGNNQNVRCAKHTHDPIMMSHRPLIYYLIVSFMDFSACLTLYRRGYTHYRVKKLTSCFPFRVQTVFAKPSPHPELGYWYRPHRSATKDPILFLHGVGVGLSPYLPFLDELGAADPDVGIIAIEDLPISSRITSVHLPRDAFLGALTQILDFHGFEHATLLGHSYGTFLAGHALRDPAFSRRVSSAMLIDPAALLLFMPNLIANFVYRPNGLWTRYFVCRDPDISRTAHLTLALSETAICRDDLSAPRGVALVIAGDDHLMDTREIWRHVTSTEEPMREWRENGLEVLYVEGLGHSAVFSSRETREAMVAMAHKLAARDEKVDVS